MNHSIKEKEMERSLCDAALDNNVSVLQELLLRDPLVLDKAILNSQDMNPLHVAAMFGRLEFVRGVLRVCPHMCLAADRFGRIPLHLAAMKGKLEVLEELIRAKPLSAREKIDGGGNVLHLCVKYNQLEALKRLVETIKDGDFANRKDDEGMTILHLAICDKQTETIKYLLDSKKVEVNAKNANGSTALDLVQGESNPEIAQILRRNGAQRGSDIGSSSVGADGIGDALQQQTSPSPAAQGSEWLSRKRDSLMVVAILIAQMAFQAGINPAGGVWQDDEQGHTAGSAVMAHKGKHPTYYKNYIRFNTIAFVSSLSTILLLISGLPFKNKFPLWALMVIMWMTITAIALSYGVSLMMVTPLESQDYVKSLSSVIKTSVTVWCGVMSLLLLGNTVRLINRWLIKHFDIDLFRKFRRHGSAQVKSNHLRGNLQLC